MNEQNTKQQASATKREVTPKLRCIVTGKERLTNKAYLDQKAKPLNGDVEKFVNNYISREALKLLRAGKSLAETRQSLNAVAADEISAETLAEAMRINGKWGNEAK